MASVLVEFVGGPLDGHRRTVPADCLTGRPVASFKAPIAVPQQLAVRAGMPTDAVPFDTVTYLRQVSDRRDGPLWLMHYAPEQRLSYAELLARRAR